MDLFCHANPKMMQTLETFSCLGFSRRPSPSAVELYCKANAFLAHHRMNKSRTGYLDCIGTTNDMRIHTVLTDHLPTQSAAVSVGCANRTHSIPVDQAFGGDQESFSDAARLKTNEPLAAVRVSLTKYPTLSNWYRTSGSAEARAGSTLHPFSTSSD